MTRPLLALIAAGLCFSAAALPVARAIDETPIDLVPCDSVEGPPNNARFQPLGGVNGYNGGFTLTILDFFGGPGPAATLYRSYFSLDTRSTSLGPAWQHNFDVRLRLATGGQGDMLFTLPSGAVERFVKAWGNTPTRGQSRGYRVLDMALDGTWHVTDDDTLWHFSPNGDFTAVDTPDGRAEIGWENGVTVAVSDGVDQTFAFEYRPDGLLDAVVEVATGERFVEFEFDDVGRLTTARRLGAPEETYVYDAATERIVAVAHDGEVVLALKYDDRGRVVREQDAQGLVDGGAVTYVYESLPNGWVQTTVTYPESLVEPGWYPRERLIHDGAARLREMVFERTSSERLVGRYDYDSENRRIILEDPCASFRQPPPQSPLSLLWTALRAILEWLARAP